MPIESEMVTIPAGPVTLGVPDCPEDIKPHRWVRSRIEVPAFAIARYPVSVKEYLAFGDETGYAISPMLRTDPRFTNQRAPAAFVSWIDAVRYTQWLARSTGKAYRMVR